MPTDLISYLETFVTERRLNLFEKILADRTRYMTVVLEDIYQGHNASAVLRSCDCFGVQDVHVIENRNEYQLSSDVTMGSDKWLNLYRYNSAENNSLQAIQHLKDEGYRIIATTPRSDSVSLEDFDFSASKFALLFGTELTGLSDTAVDNADEFLQIPMVGFTESFNISVSAAIILYQLSSELWKSDINWQLNEQDEMDIKLAWLRKSIKDSEGIEKDYYSKSVNSQKLIN